MSTENQNPLDIFDLTTYDFEFYIIEPESGGEVLLAKTAQSPYFIDDVEIKSVIAPNTDTGTSLAVQIDFTIKEPNSAFFLQYMQEQALSVGVSNYLKTNFLLKLNFNASNQGDFIPRVFTPAYEWEIAINDCNVTIDSTGATYQFKSVSTNQYAHSNQYGMITESVSIEADTIYSFFDQLSGELKKMKKNEAAAHRDKAKVDEYVFIFSDEVVGDGSFVSKHPQEEMSSANDAVYNEQDWTEAAIQVAENIEIARLIDMAVTSTEFFQQKVKQSRAPDTNERKKYDPKNFYIIVPKVEVIGYDTARHDYIRRFTYEVKPYKKVTAKTQPGEETDPELQVEPFKEYEYIFTESNIHVLNLDVRFNFGGLIPMTSQSGVTTTQASSMVGARMKAEEDHEDVQSLVEILDEQYGVPADPSYGVGDIINTYVADNADHHSEHGFPATRTPARRMASTYWLESLVDRKENMLQIELEIRGDPSWLRETYEDRVTGDIFFDLKVKSPRPSDIEGDWVSSEDQLVLTGQYQVIDILSSFSGGKFTQKLNAVRKTRNRNS